MLGHLAVSYMNDQHEFNVKTVSSRWPSDEIMEDIKKSKSDIIINCIGAIPQKTKDFAVNTQLPRWLEINLPPACRIIHPGTDCEMDDDDYGSSKREASEYIQNTSDRTRIIQTSIIGPELSSSAGLFSWFMGEKNNVDGWTKHMWNGNTTLEWSKQCLNIIKNWEKYSILTTIEGQRMSKYEVLILIKKIFNKNTEITPVETPPVDKCLSGTVKSKALKEQLEDLKNFMFKRKKQYGQYFTA